MNEYRYLPMTESDKEEMYKEIGIESSDELFESIPDEIRFERDLEIPYPTSEVELKTELSNLANKNANTSEYTSFLGAGVYDHYIPSVVDHVISRSEFYTAYTPYQPEISQGELQAIFEFQTMICELTNMEVANSSLYDGGTALGEAINMSHGHTKRKKVLVSKTVHPEYRQVIETYAKGFQLEVVEIPALNGKTDLDSLEKELDDETACFAVQYPNFYGQLEPMKEIGELVKKDKKRMFITSSNPMSLGILTPPGDFGADIVVGDTQVFGIPAQFGGPHCGYFATTKKLMRKVPGRLVGETVDENGVRGYVLTLQAREQHIRRDKATSNICSNQALYALASAVAMSTFGKEGIQEIAKTNIYSAHHLKTLLTEKYNIPVMYSDQFFNELVVDLKQPVGPVNKVLLEKGIIGGYDLGNISEEFHGQMLIAVTEKRTLKEIEMLAMELGDLYED